MYNKKFIQLIGFCFFAFLYACKQGEPPVIVVPEIKGDFAFAGYQWKYKNAATPVGPGPNRFSGTNDFAWVDALGKLHLKIAKREVINALSDCWDNFPGNVDDEDEKDDFL